MAFVGVYEYFAGPPVLSFEERFRAISAVKWVDEVNVKRLSRRLQLSFLSFFGKKK